MTKKLILIFCVALNIIFANGYEAQIDSIFTFYNDKTPSVAIAVIQNGKITFEKAYGMASLELNVPATTKSVYRIGSLSKQITAACILMLEQDGKLSGSDKMLKYFPELPANVYGDVTIDQMIYHTSGIRDAEAMYPLIGIEYSQWYTHDMMLEMLARQNSLCFPAGSEYEYSNSAYTLLALIVEKVSGQNFVDFVQANIFDVMGMQNSYIQSSPETFIPNRTSGYRTDWKQYYNWMTNNQLLGHDAVYSSVDDFFLWQQTVQNKKLGNYDLSEMTIPGMYTNGNSGNYGYGLVMGKYHGLDYYCHDGWYVGYKAFIMTLPELDFAVIAFSNLGNKSTRPLALRVVDLYLKEKFVENSKELLINDPRFETFAKQDTLIRLRLGGFKKVSSLNHYIKSPYNKDEYCSPDHQVLVRFIEEDGELKLLQETSYGSENIYTPFQYRPITEKEKSLLCGHYFSSELDNDAIIYKKQNDLYIKVGLTEGKIYKINDTKYVTEESTFELIKTNRKGIKKFSFSTYGVQGIIFNRLK